MAAASAKTPPEMVMAVSIELISPRLNDVFSCVNTVFVNNACVSTPIKRVEAWLSANDKKWADLARSLRYTEQRLTNWKKRGEIPRAEFASVAQATGLSIDYIATGKGNDLPVPRRDTILIPVLAVSGSMGDGEDQDEDRVIERLTLKRDWVATHLPGCKPDALAVISGRGNSMAPTFSDGDLLMVDTSIRQVDVDGVYVLSAHDRLFIKTVRQRMDGTFEISSDNPTVKTVDVLDGSHAVTVHGRVVWAWNGNRL